MSSAEIPSARYRDPEFLRREIEEVFPRSWFVVARLEQLPRPGSYQAFSEVGLSLVAVRGADDVVRVFHNSCRHRGTRLVAGRGCATDKIRCPYHGWAYALDGPLLEVSDPDGFDPPIDKATHGLIPVRCEAWGGFVWVNLDGEAAPLRDYLSGIAEELDIHALEEMRPIQERVWTVKANWKAVLDNASESYHLPQVHGTSLQSYCYDRPQLSAYGDHFRAILPLAPYRWRRAIDEACSPPGVDYTDEQKSVFHKYVVFPNTLVNVMPYHLTVFRAWPDGVDRCRLHYGFYERRSGPLLGRLRARLTHLVSLWIWREDRRILEAFQAGVSDPHNESGRAHAEEAYIAHFHGVLSRYLEPGSVRVLRSRRSA